MDTPTSNFKSWFERTRNHRLTTTFALLATLSAGITYVNEMNVLCFSAGDQMEGINAFREKREAAFER